MLAMGGCQNAAGDPGGDSAAPVPAESVISSAHAGPPWYSVAGDGPEFSGSARVTTGPLASLNGFDNDAQFQRLWAYTGRVRSATVDINRAEPGADNRGSLEQVERVSKIAGHLVAALPGIGDGGLAVLDREKKGADRPLVRAHACSGNASVSVLMYVDGVINDEADLTAHSPELIAALNEVLEDLRPR
ncbi:hypothetical protein [Actinoplanes sp. NPDC026623]|uniref:hypothetical protein n=1 Tax=Actinoplanes sp. NPDC026623 TaxID=3155610 RepID=UPI0033BFD52D